MSIEQPTRVAINCLVYNHEPYLRQCFDGFVKQQTKFRFVAIVHDDASTDGSAQIIREYTEKYPDIFHPIYESENQYSKGNIDAIMFKAIAETNAKYVAICEGDDYWVDPLKLQKQVDVLESDNSLMGCCTNCMLVDQYGAVLEEKRIQPVVKDNKEGIYNLRDFFAQGHQYPTASVMYRRRHIEEVAQKQETMKNPYMGDWTMWIALHCFGGFYYLDQVTSAYRINPTSVTHSGFDKRRLGQAKDNFRLIPMVASVLPEEYVDIKEDLVNNTAWMWYKLAIAYKHVHRYFSMMYCLFVYAIKKTLK